jgi:hypothetical protein
LQLVSSLQESDNVIAVERHELAMVILDAVQDIFYRALGSVIECHGQHGWDLAFVTKVDGLKRKETEEALVVLRLQAGDNGSMAFWFAGGWKYVFKGGNRILSDMLEVVNFANL